MTENHITPPEIAPQLTAIQEALATLMPELTRLIMLLSEADGGEAAQRLEQLIEAMGGVVGGLTATAQDLKSLLDRLGALPAVLERLASIEATLKTRDETIEVMARQMAEWHRWMSEDA